MPQADLSGEQSGGGHGQASSLGSSLGFECSLRMQLVASHPFGSELLEEHRRRRVEGPQLLSASLGLECDKEATTRLRDDFGGETQSRMQGSVRVGRRYSLVDSVLGDLQASMLGLESEAKVRDFMPYSRW